MVAKEGGLIEVVVVLAAVDVMDAVVGGAGISFAMVEGESDGEGDGNGGAEVLNGRRTVTASVVVEATFGGFVAFDVKVDGEVCGKAVDDAAIVGFMRGISESITPTGPFKSTSDSGQVSSSG